MLIVVNNIIMQQVQQNSQYMLHAAHVETVLLLAVQHYQVDHDSAALTLSDKGWSQHSSVVVFSAHRA